MRVIAGTAKGRHLKSPKDPGVRPTSDLVKGAIFSMLDSLEADYSRTLDLYAGTGAMGIEALSRGGERADFVERKPVNCSLIRENLELTGLADQSHVYCADVRKALGFLSEEYTLIFLDPPYDSPETQKVLEKLLTSPLVGEDSTVVLEHSKRLEPEDEYGAFLRAVNRRHGDKGISIYLRRSRS